MLQTVGKLGIMLTNLESGVSGKNLAMHNHLTCAASLPWSLSPHVYNENGVCSAVGLSSNGKRANSCRITWQTERDMQIKAKYRQGSFNNDRFSHQQCLKVTMGNTETYMTECTELLFDRL